MHFFQSSNGPEQNVAAPRADVRHWGGINLSHLGRSHFDGEQFGHLFGGGLGWPAFATLWGVFRHVVTIYRLVIYGNTRKSDKNMAKGYLRGTPKMYIILWLTKT